MSRLTIEKVRQKLLSECALLGSRVDANAVNLQSLGRAVHSTMLMIATFDKRLTEIEKEKEK